MSLIVTYDDDGYGGGADLTAGLAPTTVQLPQRAENGEPSFGALPIENGAALTGHRPVTVEESDCSQPRLFTGYTTQRDFSRSAENALIVGDDRLTDITIVDQNAIFGFRIIWDTDGNRPEETWDARLAWILGSDYMSGLFGGDTTFIDSHDNPMDAADYRGATPGAVFDDLNNRFEGAMNYFAFWNPSTSDVEIAFFGIDEVIGACTLQISNVESEIDNSTTFAPDMVAKLAREPDQVYSSVIVRYATGQVYRTLPSTAVTYIERGTTIDRPYTGKASTATSQGDQFLAMHAEERDRITCVMRSVPADSVGLVQAGMSMDVKFSHLPDYESGATMRIVMCSPVPVTDIGDLYDISLELVGGAPVPPPVEFHQLVLSNAIADSGKTVDNYGPFTTLWQGSSEGQTQGTKPIVQDTDDFCGHGVGVQLDYDVSTWTIPAGLGGTYEVGWEEIPLGESSWWDVVAGEPRAVPYVPGGADGGTGPGTAGDASVTYKLLANGVEVASSTDTHAGLGYWLTQSHLEPTLVDLAEGDEMSFTTTYAGVVYWGSFSADWSIEAFGSQQGIFWMRLVAGGTSSTGGEIGPYPPGVTTIHTVDPTVDDDETAAYAVGSIWVNTVTGEAFILTDATDGAAVWVSITDPAAASETIDANAAPYNCVGDDSTDDTAGIQLAIDAASAAAATNGVGIVEFDEGTYKIAGALVSTGNYYAQITLPNVANTAAKQIIVIRPKRRSGITYPNVSQTVVQPGPVVFRSTLTGQTYSGTHGTPSIFGGNDPEKTATYSNVQMVFEDIGIRAPANPTVCGLNLQGVQQAILDNVRFDTTEAIGSITEPTAPTGCSVLMPLNGNNATADYRGLTHVMGWYAGPGVTEHTQAEKILSYRCKVGLNIQGDYYHAAQIDHLSVEHCPYGIATVAPASGIVNPSGASGYAIFNIDLWDIEDAASGWAVPTYHVNDPGNDYYGRVRYVRVVAVVGTQTGALTVNGATNLARDDLTTAQSFAPTTVDYLVGTASGSLSAEIVVGTTPGGELGGTWASPTVDATHAGSTHLALGSTSSTAAAGDHTHTTGGVGPLLIEDTPAGSPLVFADLLQNEEGTDLLYADTA